MTSWLIGALASLAMAIGGYFYGVDAGETRQIAKQATMETVAELAAGKVADKAAGAISDLKVVRTTIVQKATHEIQTNTVYADCKHTDSMLATVNQALTGRTDPAPKSVVPSAVGVDGPGLRSDDTKANRYRLNIPGMPGIFGLGGKSP